MKKKEKEQLMSRDIGELRKQITELEKKIVQTIGERATKQTKDIRAVKKMRKEIAILLTFVRQKELVHE